MKKKFIKPLEEVLETFWQERFEQVQLQIEHDFDHHPVCKQHYDLYHDAINELKTAYPDAADRIEHLVSALHLYYSDLAMEAYRQGAKDWMQLYHSAHCPYGHCPIEDEED